ncbi:hypothetical protein BpHYR1_052212 [Brachionus plicatilis]|uniref:Uncharacterized protein n=1 Tax=Brachionus plicatilis TaxID=10195 RepID=A0A3M7PFT3_BRAPC|nr:hypothetical protein BpHYR1_052212 [Brachionus plicatilis]
MRVKKIHFALLLNNGIKIPATQKLDKISWDFFSTAD